MRDALEVKLCSKLELTRIVSGGRTAKEPAIARTLSERVDVRKERRRRTFVKAIEHIEHLADDVQAEPFAKAECTGNAKVDRRKSVRDAHVASEASGRKLAVGDQGRAVGRAGYTKRSVGREARTIGLGRLVVVRVYIRDDVERSA